MDVRTAALKVKEIIDFLNGHPGEPVFDEWVLIQILEHQWKVLMYQSPRKEELKRNFKEDISSLKPLDPSQTQVGEFSFSNRGHGTKFDAYLHAGDSFFFLFNNTKKAADEITSDPSWERAQGEFERLEELFIRDPVEEG